MKVALHDVILKILAQYPNASFIVSEWNDGSLMIAIMDAQASIDEQPPLQPHAIYDHTRQLLLWATPNLDLILSY